MDKPGFNDDTALGLAAFQGPTECVRALVAAKANLAHVKATGSTHLMSACDNPGVTEAMLELLIPQVRVASDGFAPDRSRSLLIAPDRTRSLLIAPDRS